MNNFREKSKLLVSDIAKDVKLFRLKQKVASMNDQALIGIIKKQVCATVYLYIYILHIIDKHIESAMCSMCMLITIGSRALVL